MLTNLIIKMYRSIFAHRFFSKFNNFLFLLSLHGLGILNYENLEVSGELAFVSSYLGLIKTKSPFVVDIGANEGAYSSLITFLSPKSSVVAFEPHPKTFKKIEKIAKQSSFKVINYGMSDKPGILKFYDYKEKDGSAHASLYKNVIEKIHNKPSTVHKIKVTTLDAYFSKTLTKNKTINLLKVDTEGHEYNVLLGAQKLLKAKKIDVIQFEFNDMNIESKTFLTDFIRLLDDYVIFRVLPNSLLPIGNFSPLFIELFAFQNIVAIRKDLKSVVQHYKQN